MSKHAQVLCENWSNIDWSLEPAVGLRQVTNSVHRNKTGKDLDPPVTYDGRVDPCYHAVVPVSMKRMLVRFSWLSANLIIIIHID